MKHFPNVFTVTGLGGDLQRFFNTFSTEKYFATLEDFSPPPDFSQAGEEKV